MAKAQDIKIQVYCGADDKDRTKVMFMCLVLHICVAGSSKTVVVFQGHSIE